MYFKTTFLTSSLWTYFEVATGFYFIPSLDHSMIVIPQMIFQSVSQLSWVGLETNGVELETGFLFLAPFLAQIADWGQLIAFLWLSSYTCEIGLLNYKSENPKISLVGSFLKDILQSPDGATCSWSVPGFSKAPRARCLLCLIQYNSFYVQVPLLFQGGMRYRWFTSVMMSFSKDFQSSWDKGVSNCV